MIIKIAAAVLAVFLVIIVNSTSDDIDKLEEDIEQEEYLKQWKEKRNGKYRANGKKCNGNSIER